MRKIFVSAMAILSMVACSMDETVNTQSPAKIAFDGAFVEKQTRAEDPSTTTASINEFYVWAIIDEAKGLVFDDERVWKNGDAWAYTETQYWTPGHTYYFSAIAGDRSNEQIVLDFAAANGMDVDGLGVATFKNVEGTNDFLYAEYEETTAANLNAAPEAVSFQFHHLLSKVKFTFENGFANNNNTIIVKNVKFNAPATGDIDLTADAFAWENQAGAVELNMGHVALGANVAAGQSASSDNERLTIPAPAAQEYTVTFDVERHMGEVVASTASKTVKISGVELLPGRAYNFKATINQDNVDENPLYEIVFKVAVDEWEESNVVVEDGYLVETDNAGNTSATVENAQGLQTVAEAINNGALPSDTNVSLSGDIDLSEIVITRSAVASNWIPVGTEDAPFTGTFDGKGYTIKNLALVEQEAKEGKAYIGFFGYAKNAIIKNVTFENVYINIPCLDIDHSQGHIGAVAGSLEGTSTIENVTVKGDVQIYTTQTANGASRVAVIAGGNSYGDVTMKNVHVEANEGSYLVANNNVGALAGQLQGKMVFENCSSNIDVTANKFFAGGLVGIAAGDSYIKNCHTSGDIAVVAGRENRHNDEYRVGGIAGGWADGKTKVCTLEGCSYTGKVSGKNADGTVAEPLDYMGYVGRGYTLNNCEGSKVIIDDLCFTQVGNAAPFGIYNVTTAAGEQVVTTNDELDAALVAGARVYVADGNYTMTKCPAGVTVIGVGKNVVLDVQGKKFGVHGDVAIENAKLVFSNANYTGFQHTNVESYKNCTIVGQPFLYGNKVTFEGCTFEQTSADAYNVWTYGAADVEFVNCVFNSAGKSVLIYHESLNTQNVKLEGCVLNASAPVAGKAAIEIDSSLIKGAYNVTINGTTANGFAEGNVSGNTLWNNKKGTKTNITVDGVKVL